MIARGAPEIFAALTNFGPGSRWYTQVAEAQIEPAGMLAPGSRITQVRLDGARREETRYLVQSFELDRELRLQSVGARPASIIEYLLTEAAADTRLSCSIRIETGGLLRLVESRLGRDLERKLESTLASFKESMERQ